MSSQPTPNPQEQPGSSTGATVAPAKTETKNKNGNGGGIKIPPIFGPIVTAIVILLIVGAIIYLGVSSHPAAKPGEKDGWLSLTGAWLGIMTLLVALCIFLGCVISGRPLGILVGSRNLMSLSRFQMVAWSVVILSAVLAIAFRRIVLFSGAEALNMAIDQHLWALLGISTVSLVGTPLILQNKTTKEPDPSVAQKTSAALQATGDQESVDSINQNRQGTLYANPDIKDARITDMFEGDEVGNTAYVDIAKVQMFLFTIITIMAYCYQIFHLLAGLPAVPKSEDLQMPVVSAGLVAMLGISHAGYLGSKTANHTPPPSNGGN